MNPEAHGDISNEFFKKLNQQIVQKDNLIKLLQLQIRNLKTQIEAGGTGSEELVQLKKALEEKSTESERLLAELDAQKNQFGELELAKDEQIRALSEMLEQHQASGSTVAEVVEDPRVAELEQIVSSLREELEKANQAVGELQSQLVTSAEGSQQAGDLQMALDASQAEVAQLSAAVEEIKAQLMTREAELANAVAAAGDASAQTAAAEGFKAEIAARDNRILELEQDVNSLKNIIAEKDEAAGPGAGSSEELVKAMAEIERLQSQIASLKANPVLPPSVSDELEKLRQEVSAMDELKAELAKLHAESDDFAEAAMKVTALEAERDQLANELESL